MIIKERRYKKCSKCGARKFVAEEVYGCDVCKKQIDITDSVSYLHFTVFRQSGDTEHLHLCSWDCVLEKLSTLESDYFVDLPYLYFDGTRPDREDFFKAMQKFCEGGNMPRSNRLGRDHKIAPPKKDGRKPTKTVRKGKKGK